MSDQNKTDKPADPYQKYKDFKWQNPEQFKNGPIDDESRKCRDCVCCFIFILIFILCIIVAVFGFIKGKPSQLFYFYDEDGNACGHDKGFEDYPYLYFYDVINGLQHFSTDKLVNGFCVKKCPNDVLEPGQSKTLECKRSDPSKNCVVQYENYYQSKPL